MSCSGGACDRRAFFSEIARAAAGLGLAAGTLAPPEAAAAKEVRDQRCYVLSLPLFRPRLCLLVLAVVAVLPLPLLLWWWRRWLLLPVLPLVLRNSWTRHLCCRTTPHRQ